MFAAVVGFVAGVVCAVVFPKLYAWATVGVAKVKSEFGDDE